jgi:hypothetical protein
MRIKGPGDFGGVHSKNMSEETKRSLKMARKEGVEIIKEILAGFECGEASVYFSLPYNPAMRIFVAETLRAAGWWVLHDGGDIRVYHPNPHDDGRF